MLTLQNGLLFFSTLFCALITGLLYGYAVSVNPGLGKLPDQVYLKAMQAINREILNPLFFISFLGTLLILPISTWYIYQHASTGVFHCLLAASLFYVIGVFGVTMLGNVPLNETLAVFNTDKASTTELSQQRVLFEVSWIRYHNIRTICAVVSLLFTILSLIKLTAK